MKSNVLGDRFGISPVCENILELTARVFKKICGAYIANAEAERQAEAPYQHGFRSRLKGLERLALRRVRGATGELVAEVNQPSLRDSLIRGTVPGVETPGYSQKSLRDLGAAKCRAVKN